MARKDRQPIGFVSYGEDPSDRVVFVQAPIFHEKLVRGKAEAQRVFAGLYVAPETGKQFAPNSRPNETLVNGMLGYFYLPKIDLTKFALGDIHLVLAGIQHSADQLHSDLIIGLITHGFRAPTTFLKEDMDTRQPLRVLPVTLSGIVQRAALLEMKQVALGNTVVPITNSSTQQLAPEDSIAD